MGTPNWNKVPQDAALKTLFVTHPVALRHEMGEGHPERPDRLRAIERTLEGEAFQTLAREIAPLGTREAILRVHPEVFIADLESSAPDHGYARVDGDTSMNPFTALAALRAAGAAVQATDLVPLQPIVVGRYLDCFARDSAGWHFTSRIADVEMVGDVSDHLLIDPGKFDDDAGEGRTR